MTEELAAPGAPGIPPTWCSSDKDLVGTAMGPARVWYTLGHGIVNEVYYPRIDIPQIRDLGFIVADDAGFWVEVKRLGDCEVKLPAPGIPLPRVVHRHERFTLTLRACPDPERDVLVVELSLDGDAALRPYVLLAPHLGGSGRDDRAWAGRHHGRKILWAEQAPFGLALAAVDEAFRDAFGITSAGYVGASDAWQDFATNGRMTWSYPAAGPGNVALAGGLPRRACLVLGLATSKEAAATLAVAALAQSFDALWEQQTAAWEQWHREREARTPAQTLPAGLAAQYRTSAMVLKCHRDKTFTGAMVASLSVPWGNTGSERSGYHLVWPRDLVESATALLALGGEAEARNVLRYLIATQNADGHWHQNQWLGGKPYWTGIQLDEAAFPVLLAAALAERGCLDGIPTEAMVRRALGFIVREGPASPQDRWEEDAGVNTFTLAVCIAALVAGAAMLPKPDRDLALGMADFWNARLEDWTVARDTELARRHGIAGYYVREAPPGVVAEPGSLYRALPIKNRAEDLHASAADQVALDVLQLVRLGLRRADDRLIRDSVRLADALLRSDTPMGAVWHRYTGDGYGEHPDGSPFDGTGVGRGWPLLTGERGHYALMAGDDPLSYLEAMAAMSGSGGLLPEQVWDAPPIPARGLFPGRPTGSAMPLAWAHGEFVKLAASRHLGRPFDRPALVWSRYSGHRPDPGTWVWTPGAPIGSVAKGKDLLLLLPRPASVHLGLDGWREVRDRMSSEVGLGLEGVRIGAEELAGRNSLELTWRWRDSGAWLGEDFRVRVLPA
ncbi:MAG: glycoside hydrolase family 15 protein [Chromatiales bacterium]